VVRIVGIDENLHRASGLSETAMSEAAIGLRLFVKSSAEARATSM
jgi:hypothetical protein